MQEENGCATYFSFFHLAELTADLFGVKLAPPARISRTVAARLQNFVVAVRDLVAGAAVKHMDETGFRVGGTTQWLHVACTALLSFYRVCAKRGSLLANVIGIVVHIFLPQGYAGYATLFRLHRAVAPPSGASGLPPRSPKSPRRTADNGSDGRAREAVKHVHRF